MKKHYKVKETNKLKLKSYLKDATKTDNKRSGRSARRKHGNTKHNDLY
jgi:hypothetical protein